MMSVPRKMGCATRVYFPHGWVTTSFSVLVAILSLTLHPKEKVNTKAGLTVPHF